MVVGREIYHSIKKSKQKNKSKKLLLGDSVGNQLFNNETNNDTINSLACNQSIGMVGQFILLNNYLKAGNHLDTLYMVFTVSSFGNNLNQVYTYHYFVKPFYTSEYKDLFTNTVVHQIKKIPFVSISRVPLILASDWAPHIKPSDKQEYTFLSPISIEYLDKIKALSVQYNFKIIVLPTPTSLNKKKLIDGINKKEIVDNNLESEFGQYFQNIIYLNDTSFFDGTHLKDPEKYTDYYRTHFMHLK